jgi:alkaline phosphatase
MSRQMHQLLCLLVVLSSALTVHAETAPNSRNLILIIGDGFDDQHVTMGRNYLVGMSGKLILDTMPYRASVQVETVSAEGQPLYVADSANTATSLATGGVTQIGRIATDIEDNDLPTIAERALDSGFRVGLVTTSSLTDATPASFLAHVSARSCEGPEEVLGSTYYGIPQPACLDDARDNGGPGSIIEQLVNSGAQVLLGGGTKFLEQTTIDDENVAAMAAGRGYRILGRDTDLEFVPPDRPILGTFDKETLEVRWRGTGGRVGEETETSWLHHLSDYLGDIEEPEPMSCEPNPDYEGTPPLASMTDLALRHLSLDNDRGFFLMIESASIDKQAHERNPCGSIGEIEQLEESLALALSFAAQHPDTAILVTADHAQAAQILPEPSLYSNYPIPIYSPGLTARVATPEGSMMRINYATNNGFSEEHTGANVPLFANDVAGPWLSPFLRQREVHDAMSAFLFGSRELDIE